MSARPDDRDQVENGSALIAAEAIAAIQKDTMRSETHTQPPSLDELKQRIAVVRAQPLHMRRYGAMKQEIIDYAQQRRRQGATIRALTRELGLCYSVLAKWLRMARYDRTGSGRDGGPT